MLIDQPNQHAIREASGLKQFKKSRPEWYAKAMQSRCLALNVTDRPDGTNNRLVDAHLLSFCKNASQDTHSNICDIIAGVRLRGEGKLVDLCLPCAGTSLWPLKYHIDQVQPFADYPEQLAAHMGEIKARLRLPELKRSSRAEEEPNPLESLRENEHLARLLEASKVPGANITAYQSDYQLTPVGHVGTSRYSGATGKRYPDIVDMRDTTCIEDDHEYWTSKKIEPKDDSFLRPPEIPSYFMPMNLVNKLRTMIAEQPELARTITIPENILKYHATRYMLTPRSLTDVPSRSICCVNAGQCDPESGDPSNECYGIWALRMNIGDKTFPFCT